ncbi:MAG TPA: 1-acyl-sn-glycerol-3-phosphate acyltransferase [Anaeromyxobacteraceae bacterium]
MSDPGARPRHLPRSARRSPLDRWFSAVRIPPEAAGDLSSLAARGSLVFVVRSAGVLNFLFLAWLARRLGLPPVRVALGLRGLVPWLARVRSSARALEEALRRGRSAVVFLARARGPDAFPLLAALQRRVDRPMLLVPALLVWSRRPPKLKPALADTLFGAPDAPNPFANAVAYLRNRKRAFLRLGRATDLAALIADRPDEDPATLGRKLRGALHHHLAREFRAAVGPPVKTAERIRGQVLRDRGLRRALEAEAAARPAPAAALAREARRCLDEIASRYSPAFIELVRPLFSWFFRRTYDSVEVDAKGLARVKRAAAEAPLVLCPSHKSHVDYLCLSWLFYESGLTPPHIAAGVNLAFWPFGRIARMGGAFFIRRSVRGDRVYTAVLRAYVKRLLADRFPQEFFPEGGRSRTGKLLFPRTGLFSMEVDAWLDGAAPDVLFVPVAIDYEELMEARSHAQELAGGEKSKESLRGLWKARSVLTRRYGRLYVQFEEPVSLRELAARRLGDGAAALEPDEVLPAPDEAPRPRPGEGDAAARKRELVQALANRVAWGISRAATVTPVGLLAAAVLSHPRRGISAGEVARRVELLRTLAAGDRARFGRGLDGAPSDPRRPGVLAGALARFADEGLVRVEEAAGETLYLVAEERRPLLDFHRNAVLGRFVATALAASALRAAGRVPVPELRERTGFLSRLFKLEFAYRSGARAGEVFSEQLALLERLGAAAVDGGTASVGPEPATLEFLADMLRPHVESYRVAAEVLGAALGGGEALERKALVRLSMERGRAAWLAGRILYSEALSRPTLENAFEWFAQQGALEPDAGRVRLADSWRGERLAGHLAAIDFHLR